jgi:sulfate adenylyltransferase
MLWHALVRRNYGCSHVLEDRRLLGTGPGGTGGPGGGIEDDPREGYDLIAQHTAEVGIEIVRPRAMVFLPASDSYVPVEEVPEGAETLALPVSELRSRLADGGEIPGWFSFPAIVEELRRTHPPRSQQGFTVFLTGLSGSGKSTIANALLVRLMEAGRKVTLLDGDLVRKHLSSDLGFSKEHRDLNVRRIGYVASEITKAGGIALCCPIAPYDSVRQAVRALVEPHGGFVLVHVATPLEVCERRDRKGLYAKARAGSIQQFTGISDPYETPADAEVTIDTSDVSPEQAADRILDCLRLEGFLVDAADEDAATRL